MIRITIIAALWALHGLVQAQAIYSGGEGDGYDMVSLELSPVGAGESSLKIDVYPTVIQGGDAVRIPVELNIEFAYLVSADGRKGGEAFLLDGGAAVRLVPWGAGWYALRLVSGDGRRFHAGLISY